MAFRYSFASEYNREKLFNIDTSNFEYFDLDDIFDGDETKVYPCNGIYISTKGYYGEHPVVAMDDKYVNLPQHMMDMVKDILNDKRAVKAINDGTVGFTIYTYEQKRYGTTCYSIRWVDIKPNTYPNVQRQS
jgi:hypothetical protein